MHKNNLALIRVLTAFVACVATAPVATAGLGDFLLPKHDVRIITVTDMTPEGVLQPSFSNVRTVPDVRSISGSLT